MQEVNQRASLKSKNKGRIYQRDTEVDYLNGKSKNKKENKNED